MMKISSIAISLLLMLSAIYVFYQQPSWLTYFQANKLPLNGHMTSFKLSDVTMKNQYGELVSWQDYQDRPLYVTLGFTSCPNTCPVTMSYYKNLARLLDDQAVFSLITIDPVRDTESVMRSYLGAINESFVGLIIKDTQRLNRVAGELKQSIFVSSTGNEYIHSGTIYLIHPKASGLIIYNNNNLNIESMLDDFQRLGRTNFNKQTEANEKKLEI
ncbi:MAG: SCO family protein [Kangiellaceae bacterium]